MDASLTIFFFLFIYYDVIPVSFSITLFPVMLVPWELNLVVDVIYEVDNSLCIPYIMV